MSVSTQEDDKERTITDLRQQRTTLAWILAVVLLLIATGTFNDFYITVGSPLDGYTEAKVFYVSSTWWGLVKENTEVRWMRPSGEQSDYQDWCYQAEDGSWIPFFDYEQNW